MTVFAKRIKKLREARGWKQRELRDKLGLDGDVTVSRWEAGKFTPPTKDLYTIAEKLGVPFWWLILSDEDIQSIVASKGHLTLLQGGKVESGLGGCYKAAKDFTWTDTKRKVC